MTEKEEIIRGDEADRLLNHPLFADALNAVRNGIINGLATSAMGDSQTHNRLAIALQILNSIERQIKDHIATGKMAQLQIKEGVVQRMRNVAGL